MLEARRSDDLGCGLRAQPDGDEPVDGCTATGDGGGLYADREDTLTEVVAIDSDEDDTSRSVGTVGRLGESQLIATVTALAGVSSSTTVTSVSADPGTAPLPIKDMERTLPAAVDALAEAG